MKMMHRRAISLVTAFGVIISCACSRPLIKSVSAAVTDNNELPGLNIVQTYNLICFGDYVNQNSDVEGPSAIEGAIKVNNVTFGVTTGARHVPANNPYGLVWGETNRKGFSMNNGSSQAKAFVYEKLFDKFNNYTYRFFGGIDTWGSDKVFKKKVNFTFDSLKRDLKKTSKKISEMKSNCEKPKPSSDGSGELVLTGKDEYCNIFTVDAETLGKYAVVRIEEPNDRATNVINVTGVAGKTVMLPTLNNLSDYQKGHLLWNLCGKTTVTNNTIYKDGKMTSRQSIEGSVLAPEATFMPQSSCNYEGTLIVNSFDTSKCKDDNSHPAGFEGHFYPFTGNIPPDQPSDVDLTVNKTAKLEGDYGWDNRTYQLTLDVTAKKIATNDLQCSNKSPSISGVTVTDVIDHRFQLTGTSLKIPHVDNKDGTTTIVWHNQTITGSKKYVLHVQAKPDFIGGNNIPTNADGSGVTYGKGQYKPFMTPHVNVKPNLTVGNASATIFRGEPVPIENANNCKTWGNSSVYFQWCKADGKTPLPGVGKNVDFPNNLTPDTDISYVLNAYYDCGKPTDESNKNTNGFWAGEKKDGYVFTANGTYTVTVVSGELDLTKIMNAQYPAPDLVKPKQSFVFQITRSDPKSNCCPETFYEVITPDEANQSKTKKITGLKKGIYTIIEETGETTAAWRYGVKPEITNTDIFFGKTGNQVYIGRDISTSSTKAYFGSEKDPASVTFTNHLSNFQWFGDTAVAVNTIHN